MDLMTHLQMKYPEMTPVTTPPSLHMFNGIGTTAYGQRDYDSETGTYVKTVCFAILYIPIFATGAYRVADAAQGWYFLGKVPLSAAAKAWNWFDVDGHCRRRQFGILHPSHQRSGNDRRQTVSPGGSMGCRRQTGALRRISIKTWAAQGKLAKRGSVPKPNWANCSRDKSISCLIRKKPTRSLPGGGHRL